jgi:hypothetical protein
MVGPVYSCVSLEQSESFRRWLGGVVISVCVGFRGREVISVGSVVRADSGGFAVFHARRSDNNTNRFFILFFSRFLY